MRDDTIGLDGLAERLDAVATEHSCMRAELERERPAFDTAAAGKGGHELAELIGKAWQRQSESAVRLASQLTELAAAVSRAAANYRQVDDRGAGIDADLGAGVNVEHRRRLP